jgi:hypothetical protein
MLKTRYLKGITAEQLFIISMQKIIRDSSFINNFFKNKSKLDTPFLFYFYYFRTLLLLNKKTHKE